VVVILDLLLERILTATANGGNDSCTATAQVTYLNLKYRCLLAVSLQMLLVLSTDGSIAVTNSEGSTVVITNANNEVVANTGLVAGTATLLLQTVVMTEILVPVK
jgi:hypothetical protein